MALNTLKCNHLTPLPFKELKKFILGMMEGNRQRGHEWRWIDDVLMWCSQDIQEVVKTTEDRDNWRRFVARCYGPCWPWDSRRSSNQLHWL